MKSEPTLGDTKTLLSQNIVSNVNQHLNKQTLDKMIKANSYRASNHAKPLVDEFPAFLHKRLPLL